MYREDSSLRGTRRESDALTAPIAFPDSLRTIALGGVGLVGGSLGLSIKSRAPRTRVVAFGRTEATLKRAREIGAIDEFFLEPGEAVAEADLVILAPPVRTIPGILERIAGSLKPNVLVTDAGSTKSWITAAAERVLPSAVRFVGSHPMAGSEKSGIEFADAGLFEQAVVVVTPSLLSDEAALISMKNFWRALGAVPLTLSAETHDRIVASISHLPHVVAAALVNVVARRARKEGRYWDLAAGGFRDTTRIAASHPRVWTDICLTNREMILEILDEFRDDLESFRDVLEETDEEGLKRFFKESSEARKAVPPRGAGVLEGLADLYVEVPDHPGEIARVTGILAARGINIVDLEITRVRERPDVAPLRLFFEKVGERDEAAGALTEEGITVRAPQ